MSFNQGLLQLLTGLQSYYPVTITQLDTFTLIHDVVANPDKYGIEETQFSCITPGVIVGAICEDKNEYLFWDGIHPTRKGHKIISKHAVKLFDDD